MPRLPRTVLPHYPHHIIQRGHNRQTVFFDTDDFEYYLKNLHEWKTNLGCEVYAFCLMTNHVHLIVNPGAHAENLGLLMKRIAGRQTRHKNRKQQTSGSLWEGRYKSSPIDTDQYLLTCCRYVELNPVRAHMVQEPGDYTWSSCKQKLGLKPFLPFDLDPMYESFGNTIQEKAQHYRHWLQETIDEPELKFIRETVQRGQLTGNSSFNTYVSNMLGRDIGVRGPGRPKNK